MNSQEQKSKKLARRPASMLRSSHNSRFAWRERNLAPKIITSFSYEPTQNPTMPQTMTFDPSTDFYETMAQKSNSFTRQEDTSSTDDLTTITNESSNTLVRFNLESIAILPIERVEDMDQAERDSKWYDKSDFDIIKAQNNLTVKLMKVGRQDPEQFGHCYRGLEFRQGAVKRRRDGHMGRAMLSVLDEQARQRQENIENPELLATVYEGYTMMAVQGARALARGDAEQAAIYQREAAPVVEPKKADDEYLKFDVVDDDEISVLSAGDEGSICTDEKNGIVKRFRKLVQRRRCSNSPRKQHSSNSSRASRSVSSKRRTSLPWINNL